MIRTLAFCGLVATIPAILSGCASAVSAYGGESTFNCAAKFEEGMPCDSISGTATNYSSGNLKWQRKDGAPANPSEVVATLQATAMQPPVLGNPLPAVESGLPVEKISPRQMASPSFGMPVRIPERVLRIWMAPYEDEEGALNDQKYVYLTVQRGAWQLEANKPVTQQPYKQIFPLGRAKTEREEPMESRATARQQAIGAVTNNPNITNLPVQPRADVVRAPAESD